MLAVLLLEKRPMKVPNLKSLTFSPSHEHVKKILSKCSVLASHVIFVDCLLAHQIIILSAGMYACTFQPGNFTGCGSEGVKPHVPNDRVAPQTHLTPTSEVVNDPDTLFLPEGTNLLGDGHFQFSNGLRTILMHVVLQEPPRDKTSGV